MVPTSEREPTVLLQPTAAGRTDVGRRRDHNEDQVLVVDEHGLFAVADGMGGHDAGDVASAITAASLEEYFASPPNDTDLAEAFGDLAAGAQRLASSILHANRQVYGKSGRSAHQGGMGSTVVAVYVSEEEQQIHIGHVGDSRCYRLRDGVLEQLTPDHSMVNEALKLNPDLSEDILKQLPTNVVTRALGTKESVEPDLRSEPLVAGDLYLLCSDGLTGEVSDEEISFALEDQDDIGDTCELLVAMANEAGGRDNVTALLVRIDGPDGPIAAEDYADGDLPVEFEVDEDELPPPPPPTGEEPAAVEHAHVDIDEDEDDLPPPPPPGDEAPTAVEYADVEIDEDEEELPPPPPADESPQVDQAYVEVEVDEEETPSPAPMAAKAPPDDLDWVDLQDDEEELPPPVSAETDDAIDDEPEAEALPLTKPSTPSVDREATRAEAEAALDQAVDLALAEVDFDVDDLDLGDDAVAEAALTGTRGQGVLVVEAPTGQAPAAEVMSAMPIVAVGQPGEAPLPTPDPVSIRCAECGHRLLPEERFCGMCGTHVAVAEPEPDVALCEECGHEILLGTAFCVECGAKHDFADE